MSNTGVALGVMFRLEFHDGEDWRQMYDLFESEEELRYTLSDVRERAEEYDEESSFGWRPHSYRYWAVTPDNVGLWSEPKNYEGKTIYPHSHYRRRYSQYSE